MREKSKTYRNNICLLTIALLAGLLTGCGNTQPADTMEEDMPYGATMRENKTGFAVPMAYDRRFVEEAQAAAVADYLAAIQNQDAELYTASALPVYTDYQIQKVYDYTDTSQLVTALHEGITKQTAEDFAFQMVTVQTFTKDRSFGGLEAIIDLLDNVTEDSGSVFSEQIQDAWALELEWSISYNQGAGFGTVESQWIYLFRIEDVYYCCM